MKKIVLRKKYEPEYPGDYDDDIDDATPFLREVGVTFAHCLHDWKKRYGNKICIHVYLFSFFLV